MERNPISQYLLWVLRLNQLHGYFNRIYSKAISKTHFHQTAKVASVKPAQLPQVRKYFLLMGYTNLIHKVELYQFPLDYFSFHTSLVAISPPLGQGVWNDPVAV